MNGNGDPNAVGHVDPALDPEGHLLERATSLDISGRRLD